MISRTDLGAIAGDLAGEPLGRRSAALARRLAGAPRAAMSLDDLGQTPAWVRLDNAARNEIAQRAALLALGQALSRSVDGHWLRGLAVAAGEDAVDWAAAQDSQQQVDAFDGDQLDDIGVGIVRAATPPAFHGFVADGVSKIERQQAVLLVERAMRR